MKYIKKWNLDFILLLIIILQILSCTTKSELRFKKLSKEVRGDNYLSAIETIRKNTKLYGKTNRLLYHMDMGMLFHYAMYYDSSNAYLEKAVQIYDDLFTKSVTNEAAALLINDNVRPYRSKPYEMIFLHQIMMLNHLSQSNFDAALVETRRVQLLIDQWEHKDKQGNKYTSDGFFHYMSAFSYNQVNEPDNAAISLYKSVSAYQQGIIPVPAHVNDLAYYTFLQNDRENDIKLLNLQADINRDSIIGLNRKESEIILIGNAGRGPVLGEKVWWGTWIKNGLLILHHRTPDGKQETVTLPAPGIPDNDDIDKTESGTTFHIKFAMPEIKEFKEETEYFTIQSSSIDRPVKSIIVNDMDKLCAKYLEDIRTQTILRTVVRVMTRTIAAQRAKKKMATKNEAANLFINIGTDILADQMEKADTRSIFLIPKTIHLARVPVKPGIHTVEVLAHNNSGTVIESKLFDNIQVDRGEKKFVFCSSLY